MNRGLSPHAHERDHGLDHRFPGAHEIVRGNPGTIIRVRSAHGRHMDKRRHARRAYPCRLGRLPTEIITEIGAGVARKVRRTAAEISAWCGSAPPPPPAATTGRSARWPLLPGLLDQQHAACCSHLRNSGMFAPHKVDLRSLREFLSLAWLTLVRPAFGKSHVLIWNSL